MESFAIAGTSVPPGTLQRVIIPVAPLYIQVMINLHVVVVHGVRPGPRLWVSAAIHGDEVVGAIAVRELLRRVKPESLAGTLVAVPAVNAFGLLHQSRYLPDRRDLNRSFPGSRRGSLASRLAHIFMREIVSRCTHGIDLHTAAVHRDNLPQIRANLDDPRVRRMARAFGAPIVMHADERDGSLRQAATQRGVPTLLYEGGEALRYSPRAARSAMRGTLRVMRALGMTEIRVPRPKRPPRVSRESTWVRAARSGFMILDAELGARVRPGTRLGVILARPDPAVEIFLPHVIRSRASGIVIGLTRNPLVHVGDALVHVASVRPSGK